MRIRRILLYAVLIAGAFIMLAPFLWMIITAFKLPEEILALPPVILPSKLNFKNFADVFSAVPFGRYFFNSLFVTLVSTLLQVSTAALAGYAFARFEFKGKKVLFLLFLGTMMIPVEVTLIPNYIFLMNLGWLDTYFALIIPWAVNVFAIFLMRQFFLTLPTELFEQAQIDGCSHWQILWKIVFPVSKPVFISAGIFSLIGSWNAFLWPLIMTNSEHMRTLPVGLAYFTFEFASRYHLMMAAALLATLPVVIVYFFAQKYFVEGISTTGLK